MQLQYRKWLAALAFGAMGLAGTSAVQAQVFVEPYMNITVGAPLANGAYGRIQIGSGAPLLPSGAMRRIRFMQGGLPKNRVIATRHLSEGAIGTNIHTTTASRGACTAMTGTSIHAIDGDCSGLRVLFT